MQLFQSYCRRRTLARVSAVLWGFFCLLLTASLCWGLLLPEHLSRSVYFEEHNLLFTVLFALVALLFLLLGVYLIVTGVRDVLLPARSGLAKSIRAQLPHPEEAPPYPELFELVDRDLVEHRAFGSLRVGAEWVLGDRAVRLERVRGVFQKVEVRYRRKGGANHLFQLILVDDRRESHITNFHSRRTLADAGAYLLTRVPAAVSGDGRDYSAFLTSDPEEAELAFSRRRAELVQPLQAPCFTSSQKEVSYERE